MSLLTLMLGAPLMLLAGAGLVIYVGVRLYKLVLDCLIGGRTIKFPKFLKLGAGR